MLLSTHIVDDVATLCPRLAVIRAGEVVADTSPSAARRAVDGAVHEGHVADADLPAFAQSHRVLSAVLDEGRNNRVRVFVAPGRTPPPGFQRSVGTLEDAYLALMRCPADELPPALARSAAGVRAGGAA